MKFWFVALGFFSVQALPLGAMSKGIATSSAVHQSAETEQLFAPYEKYDPTVPASFDRLIAAVQLDPKAKALYDNVMQMAGLTDPRKLIEFQSSEFGYEAGSTTITMDGNTTENLMDGWPQVTASGMVPMVADPKAVPVVKIRLNPQTEMITCYSSLIHELTHAQRDLTLVHQVPIFDVLSYQSADDFAWGQIRHSGGETDAFVAEISAVIRYRNRTHSDYVAFHTPVTEKYFSQETGEVTDRAGLEDYVAHSGGELSYLNSYSASFLQAAKGEMTWLDSEAEALDKYLVTIKGGLPKVPAPANFDKIVEEDRRVRLRAQRIRSQFFPAVR